MHLFKRYFGLSILHKNCLISIYKNIYIKLKKLSTLGMLTQIGKFKKMLFYSILTDTLRIFHCLLFLHAQLSLAVL